MNDPQEIPDQVTVGGATYQWAGGGCLSRGGGSTYFVQYAAGFTDRGEAIGTAHGEGRSKKEAFVDMMEGLERIARYHEGETSEI